MEEGEELFYMRKGNMCLKIVQNGKFMDVPIKEGEIFLLPSRIPHSPQRAANTVGLVIERERHLDERDGLRYYIDDEDTDGILYQRWFHCKDLGKDLKPIIVGFFESEQHKTGSPIKSDLDANPSPWKEDSKTCVEPPFDFKTWLSNNRDEIAENGQKDLFDRSKYQSNVSILGFGTGSRKFGAVPCETFLILWEGGASVKSCGKHQDLVAGEIYLIPQGAEWEFNPKNEDTLCLLTQMDPTNRVRVGYPALS